MTIRVGVNGFGRIGRNFFRAVKQSGADVEIVAANDLGNVAEMAHLLKYDSVMGRLPTASRRPRTASSSTGRRSRSSPSAIPAKLPWKDLGVDVVVESTGFFTAREKAAAHLEAGAPRGRHLGPRHQRRRHLRGRRQRRHLRPGLPQGRVQRLVHHQLLRPA